MNVGLFFGVFDPVHNGHIACVESLTKLSYIDEVWILVTPQPPHKLDTLKTSYTLRRQMIDVVFKGKKGVYICDIEKNIPAPNYTWKTIEKLHQIHPQHKYYMCVGEDTLSHIHDWWCGKRILSSTPLLVIPRKNIAVNHSLGKTYSITYLDHTPLSISSHQIRQACLNHVQWQDKVPSNIVKFIFNHQLYGVKDISATD